MWDRKKVTVSSSRATVRSPCLRVIKRSSSPVLGWYDREKETVAVAFHSTGFETFLEQTA